MNQETEVKLLKSILFSAPGVALVKMIEPHVKGGYAVTLDINKEHFDALIQFIPSQGYLLVF